MTNETNERRRATQPDVMDEFWAWLSPFGIARGEIDVPDDSVPSVDADRRDSGYGLVLSASAACIAAFGRSMTAATATQVFSVGVGLSVLLIRVQCEQYQAALLAYVADCRLIRLLRVRKLDGSLVIWLRNETANREIKLDVPMSCKKFEAVLEVANRMQTIELTAVMSQLGRAAQWAHEQVRESLIPGVTVAEATLSVVLPDDSSIHEAKSVSFHEQLRRKDDSRAARESLFMIVSRGPGRGLDYFRQRCRRPFAQGRWVVLRQQGANGWGRRAGSIGSWMSGVAVPWHRNSSRCGRQGRKRAHPS